MRTLTLNFKAFFLFEKVSIKKDEKKFIKFQKHFKAINSSKESIFLKLIFGENFMCLRSLVFELYQKNKQF